MSPYRVQARPIALEDLVQPTRPRRPWTAILVLVVLGAALAIGTWVANEVAVRTRSSATRRLPQRRVDHHRTPSARGQLDPVEDVDDAEIVRQLGVLPPAPPRRPAHVVYTWRDD